MKKILGFAMACATLLLATFPMSATKVTAEDSTFTPKADAILCDFEEWKPDFSTIKIGGDFGKITRSAEYVASGKYSAKLQPGGAYTSSQPTFYIPLVSKLYELKYIMSDYVAITGKFYNAGQKDVAMQIGLSFDKFGKQMPTKYTLKPGWNTITYVINHNIILMFNGSMEGVSSVFFQFDPSLSRDINDSNVIYADDIILRGAQTEVEPVDLVKLSPLEICDFERPYQEYVMSSWVYQELPPSYKILDVREGELPAGVIPTSGNCCLQMTMPMRTDGYQAYPQAIITSKVVEKAINALTDEEKQRAYISLDIYAYTTNFSFDLGFKDSVGDGINSLQPCDSLFYVSPSYKGQWTTYTYKLTDIDAPRANGIVKDDCDFTNNPYEIRFIWADFFTGGDRIIFIDNVRIELEDAE